MKPTDKKIQNLINDLNDVTRPELDETILKECSGELNAPGTPAIKHTSMTWRPVVSGLILKRVAAGLLIAAAVSLSFYAGRSTNISSTDHLTQSCYLIKGLQGTVLVKHSNSQTWYPLTMETAVYVNDQFLSSPDGRVIFAVDEQSSIELKENSMLILDITADKTNLHLVHGTLDADLASPHGPFFVTTPHGRAEALGTEFTVNVD
jgi:hypothetical protein